MPRYPAGLDSADVFHQQRGPISLCDNNVSDIVSGFQQADTSNQILLFALLEVASTGIRASAIERREELLKGDVVCLHLRRIGFNLVLFDETAVRYDIGYAGYSLQLPRDGPVLDSAHLGGRNVAFDSVAIDFPNGCCKRTEFRLDSFWEIDVPKPFQNLLPGKIRIDGIVECDGNERQPKLGVGEKTERVRNAA